MNKLLGLFLLALACWAPDVAQAANRFLTCNTTCTIDASDTSIWGTVSGGTGASVPGSGDDVIMDAGTCVGGTTCTATFGAGYNPTWRSVTWGACTASTTGCIIDASVNNNSFTLTGGSGTMFSATGTGTRKWLAGSGTYDMTSTNANGCFNMGTTTNDQGSVFSGATWICSGATTNGRTWAGGGFSFGPTTWNGNSSGGTLSVTGANTFASLTIGAPQYIQFANTVTNTITGAFSFSGGSSSNPIMLNSNSSDTPAVLSFGAANSVSWLTMRSITTTGAGSFTATDCLNVGRVTLDTGDTCTAPSGGGGGGNHIIGSL